MPSTINATSTGSGGLISTGDASGQLELQANGSTKLTVSSSGVTIPTLVGANVNLASNVTGTLPVANGGTGATTLTSNNVILGNGTSAVQFVAPGTNGNVLTSNGTTWTSAAGTSLATPLAVVGNNTAGSEIRLPEDTDNGSNYVALKAANSLASNVTFTLPDADGTSGQVIQTNGSGTLSFVSPAGAWVYISTTTASSSATISIEDNFSTYDLYAIQIVNLAAESNVSNFQVELKIDGSYQSASQYGTSQATVSNTWASATGNLPILFSNLSGNNLINAWMTLYIPKVNTSTPKKTITAIGGYIYATDSARNIHGSLNYNGGPSSNAISGFRFKFDTGNISTGTFRLYGIKNS